MLLHPQGESGGHLPGRIREKLLIRKKGISTEPNYSFFPVRYFEKG
jgi:hypothetical protein